MRAAHLSQRDLFLVEGSALDCVLELIDEERVVGLAHVAEGLSIDGFGAFEAIANALESGFDGGGGVVGELTVVASIAEDRGPSGIGLHRKLDVFIEQCVDGGIGV